MKFTVSEPVYGSNCLFMISEPFEVVKKLFEANSKEKIKWDALGKESANGFCLTVKLNSGALAHMICLHDFQWVVENMTTLAHEIAHLTFDILEHKGVPLHRENQEAFAYLYSHYYREAFTRLKEVTQKKDGNHTTTRSSGVKKTRHLKAGKVLSASGGRE